MNLSQILLKFRTLKGMRCPFRYHKYYKITIDPIDCLLGKNCKCITETMIKHNKIEIKKKCAKN